MKREKHLKIGHEHFGTTVQCIDDHFTVGRASDLNTPIEKVFGNRSTLPAKIRAQVLCVGIEVGEIIALVQFVLENFPLCQQRLAFGLKILMQFAQESQSIWGQNLLISCILWSSDLKTMDNL